MVHRPEIDIILAQVTPWPMEDRAALANELLRNMHQQPRQPAPRHTLERAAGIAAGTSTPPDDATVQHWIEQQRIQKHG